MDYQILNNKIKLNKSKNIGKVIYIVEGERREINLLTIIFKRILGYKEIITRTRSGKETFLLESDENVQSKIAIINSEKSNISSIENEKFIEEGTNIIIYRREFIKNISILLNLNYRKLFDPKSELKLKYECFLGDIDKKSREELKNKFIDQCKRKKEREKMLGYSLLGPQKDDFIFKLNDKNAKSYSSQGEKKSIIFSLKISEIDILVKEKNEYPIFIMDDVSSYFDEIRKKSILDYFINKKIQCFITSTEDLNIKGKKIIIDKGKVILE